LILPVVSALLATTRRASRALTCRASIGGPQAAARRTVQQRSATSRITWSGSAARGPSSGPAAYQHELLGRRVSRTCERLADGAVGVEVDLPVVLVAARGPHGELRPRRGELQDLDLRRGVPG